MLDRVEYVFYLLVGVFVFIVMNFFKTASYQEQLNETEKLLDKLIAKNDSHYIALTKLSNKLGPKKDLKNYCDLYVYLNTKQVPFADVWAAISIAEAGWSWESSLSRDYNNYVGLCNSTFPTKTECANYIIEWVSYDPPNYKEISTNDWESYFQRRKYNPYVGIYYPKVKEILAKIKPELHP